MTKKKDGMPDRFPNLAASIRAATEIIAHEDINSTTFKDNKFTKETNDYIDCKKYKPFNILNKNGGRSIYPPNINGVETSHIYIIINVDNIKLLDDQIKSLQKGLALLCKDLVKAGVLKTV